MSKPSIRQVVEATGISRTYACDILNGKQTPRAVSVEIFRKLNWRAPAIEDLTEEQISAIEEAERLSPTRRQAA